MTTYQTEKTSTQFRVTCPYNPDFIETAKSNLGAKWDGKCWCFDIRDEAEAIKLIERKYGWKSGMRLVSVGVTFNEDRTYGRGPCILLGRIIASASGRDSGAKLGDGVRLLQGDGATSGGSVKNWATEIYEGTKFLVHDVPEQMAKDYVDGKRNSRNVIFEIIQPVQTVEVNAAALSAERTTLAIRIAEIDAQLNQINCTESNLSTGNPPCI